MRSDDRFNIGFIAQEINKIDNPVIKSIVHYDKNEDLYSLEYSKFGVIGIKAIQELYKKIESLEAEISKLKK
jgi:hypothetical protein